MALKTTKKSGFIAWCSVTALLILANVFKINLASLLILFFGLATSWIVLHSFKLRLKIQNTPTSKIKTAESKSELVEIKAIAWPLIDIKSIFGEQVVYYHLILQQKIDSEKWIDIAEYDSRKSFNLNDGQEDMNKPAFLALDDSGVALIMLNAINSTLSQEFLKYTKIELDENKTEILKNASILLPEIRSINFFSSDKYRFTEQKILIGSPLYILSKFNPNINYPNIKSFGNPRAAVDVLKSGNIQHMINSVTLNSSDLQKRILDSCKSCFTDKYSDVEIDGVVEAFDVSKHISGKPFDVMVAPLTEYEVLNNKSKWVRSIVLSAVVSVITFSLFVWMLLKKL